MTRSHLVEGLALSKHAIVFIFIVMCCLFFASITQQSSEISSQARIKRDINP